MLHSLACGAQSHSSIQKAGMVAGTRVRLLPTRAEDDYALRAEVLEAAIEEDIAAGLLPFYVVATIGTTSSCAVDPVTALGEITQKNNLWCALPPPNILSYSTLLPQGNLCLPQAITAESAAPVLAKQGEMYIAAGAGDLRMNMPLLFTLSLQSALVTFTRTCSLLESSMILRKLQKAPIVVFLPGNGRCSS